MTFEKLGKFLYIIKTPEFISYEKSFADKITSALTTGYINKKDEPKLVELIESVVNSVNDLKWTDKKDLFEILTKSLFIHGQKSQVEFDYYGKSTQRELGDLIFVISIIFNNVKYFEKITINQFKKDKKQKRKVSWDIGNKEQLYLLSRFPTFKGVKSSLIPKRNYTVTDYSGTLGSYGLLYRPGDFVFIAARKLNSLLGYKNSISLNDLFEMDSELHKYNLIIDYPLYKTCYYAQNVHEFAHEYLRFKIGELIISHGGTKNYAAKTLFYETLLKVKKLGGHYQKFVDELIESNSDRTEYTYDPDDQSLPTNVGGLGIIHTTLKFNSEKD